MLSRLLTSAFVIFFGLTVGACTVTPAEPSALLGDRSILEGLPGSLLVLGEVGDISILSPDGSIRQELARGGDEVERAQPTWSPDGTRVVWTETVRGVSFLVTAGVDGEELTRDEAPFSAVYIAWDPTGSRIALSGNDDLGRLHLAVAVPGSPPAAIDEGAPMWIDWNPKGSELLVHIEDRFEFVPINGGSRRTIAVDGEFRVGVHASGQLVFAKGNDVGEVLVVGGTDGSVQTELLRVGSPSAFVVDPAERRLAVMSIPSASTQALTGVEPGPVPVLKPNHLVVVDLDGDDLTEVAMARSVAWFWSPTGDQLLYATQVEDEDTTRLQWHTWDGSRSISYRTFIPTGVFGRDYLAFFDQFARSHSFWAPDGSAFVYAGGTDASNRGIWVQPVAGDGPVRVALGEIASWSPNP